MSSKTGAPAVKRIRRPYLRPAPVKPDEDDAKNHVKRPYKTREPIPKPIVVPKQPILLGKETWYRCCGGPPPPFELVTLKKSLLDRGMIGWWGGVKWDGLHIRPTDEFEIWKPHRAL